MSYQIDSGVSLPEKRNRYPFAQMQPGDSFAIVAESPEMTAEEAKKVRNAAYQYARKANEAAEKKTGTKGTLRFSLRKVDGGFRLWRVDGVEDMPAGAEAEAEAGEGDAE